MGYYPLSTAFVRRMYFKRGKTRRRKKNQPNEQESVESNFLVLISEITGSLQGLKSQTNRRKVLSVLTLNPLIKH